MATPITGGCACGAIRYEASAEAVFTGHCHCRDCQRSSGGGGALAMFVPKNATKITGDVKYYEVKGETGNTVRRGFCAECGSPLFTYVAIIPDNIGIKVGSLDDPSSVKLSMDLFTGSAQPWDVMNPDIPKFPKLPPQN